jgi:hypothetical protein
LKQLSLGLRRPSLVIIKAIKIIPSEHLVPALKARDFKMINAVKALNGLALPGAIH